MTKVTAEFTDAEFATLQAAAQKLGCSASQLIKNLSVDFSNNLSWQPDRVGTVAGEGDFYYKNTPVRF